MALQKLARELSVEQVKMDRSVPIYVWGWNTLEERISENVDARKQVDPGYGPFSERILERVDYILVAQKASLDNDSRFIELRQTLARFENALPAPGDMIGIKTNIGSCLATLAADPGNDGVLL